MIFKTQPKPNDWLQGSFHAVTICAITLALGACTGMHAPYPSRPAKGPTKVILLPITPDLVSEIKSRRPKPQITESLPPPQLGDYRYFIGPGDILEVSLSPIVTFNSTNSNNLIGETGQGHVVHYDGTIYLPFAGTVVVGGLTPRDAQTRVVQALSRFLKNPEVLVSVREFRSQRVLLSGQVKTPGYVPITEIPLTLSGALVTSGALVKSKGDHDPSFRAAVGVEPPDPTHVSLQRGGQEYIIDGEKLEASLDKATDVVLLDGDVVRVPPLRRGKIFVMGEVTQPQLMEIETERTNLAEVLLSAGGLDPLTSKASRVYLIRGDLRKPTIYQLNASAPDSFLLAQEFPVQPKDVIYVSTANISRWNRFLQQLVPAVNGLYSASVVRDVTGGNNNN